MDICGESFCPAAGAEEEEEIHRRCIMIMLGLDGYGTYVQVV